MKIKIQETYRCDYCNKLYLSKYYCQLHEANCMKNPVNHRPCFQCENLSMVNADYFYDLYDGQHQTVVSALYCCKKKEFVYPPEIERKGTAFEYLELFSEERINLPMPKKCKMYINHG